MLVKVNLTIIQLKILLILLKKLDKERRVVLDRKTFLNNGFKASVLSKTIKNSYKLENLIKRLENDTKSKS